MPVPVEKIITWGGLTVATGSLIFAALQFFSSARSQQQDAPPPPPVNVAGPAVAPQPTPTPPPPPSKLPQLLNEENINRQISSFEIISGPARNADGRTRTYSVEGCEITVRIGDENEIVSLAVNLTNTCTFEWQRMAHNVRGLEAPGRVTMGQFLAYFGADSINRVEGCVGNCGNSSDAAYFVGVSRFGSHADGFIDLVASLQTEGPQEIEATLNFGNAVDAMFGQYSATDLSQVCDRRIVPLIQSHLARFRIDRIELRLSHAVPENQRTCELR